jgi:hypothetical protein
VRFFFAVNLFVFRFTLTTKELIENSRKGTKSQRKQLIHFKIIYFDR